MCRLPVKVRCSCFVRWEMIHTYAFPTHDKSVTHLWLPESACTPSNILRGLNCAFLLKDLRTRALVHFSSGYERVHHIQSQHRQMSTPSMGLVAATAACVAALGAVGSVGGSLRTGLVQVGVESGGTPVDQLAAVGEGKRPGNVQQQAFRLLEVMPFARTIDSRRFASGLAGYTIVSSVADVFVELLRPLARSSQITLQR